MRTEETFDFVCSLLYRLTILSPLQPETKNRTRNRLRVQPNIASQRTSVHSHLQTISPRSDRIGDSITVFKRDSTTCRRCTCYSCIVNGTRRLTRRARVYRVTVTQMRAHAPHQTCLDLFCSTRTAFCQNSQFDIF